MIIQQKSATGSDGYYPRLLITAPTGSVVTVNGIVITGIIGETTDTYTYVCNDYGTYTVVGTLGSKSNTNVVSIDNVKDYSISIFYRTYLYNEGDECTTLTGGWEFGTNTTSPNVHDTYISGSSSSTKIKNTTSIEVSATYPGTSGSTPQTISSVHTGNAINLTNFSVIKIECHVEGTTSSFTSGTSASHSTMRLYSTKPSTSVKYWDNIIGTVTLASLSSTGTYSEDKTLSIDLSTITSSVYVNVESLIFYCNATAKVLIKKIWLE